MLTRTDEFDAPHAAPAAEVLRRFEADPSAGLTEAEAARRLECFGSNRLVTQARRPVWSILMAQFRGAIFWLLAAAAIIAAVLGDTAEAVAIVLVLLVNGAIGFTTEYRAVKSMEGLRRLTRLQATVRREGRDRRLDADSLVPGDIVVLEAGDVIPADLRLVEARDLRTDESLLTGESMPVAKAIAPVAEATAQADRTPMAWRGTSLARGAGLGLVVATGAATELAGIARMVEEAKDERSPLEVRLDHLGNVIAVAAIVGIAMLTAAGLLAGREAEATVKTAIALAVAAVPEGLPIVATLALARGMWRMAARNALINRLSAVETLGATTVLLTDKTGTLTENRMTVTGLSGIDGPLAPDDPRTAAALEIATLCNGARIDGGERLGDPMELALLERAAEAGLARPALMATHRLIVEHPFDPETRMMATVHDGPDGRFAAVKGAPEAVIAAAARVAGPAGDEPLDHAGRQRLLDGVEAAARNGQRLLALARGPAEAPLEALTFVAFAALTDPPRRDATVAVGALRRAGIRVVMVTGDHPATARAIAGQVGLVDGGGARVCEGRDLAALDREALQACTVFARFEPRAKLDLARMFRDAGDVVAMTGDGVNDAPALKEADIGVAMGKRGTQVAAEASDVILQDDRLNSIVAAVEQGRVIYGNIRLFLRYLFACNLSEIVLIAAAIAAGLPVPLLPLQILFLNLVTDVFPAVALGMGDGPQGVMDQKPRPRDEPLLTRRAWAAIAVEGALLTAAVMTVFLIVLRADGFAAANTAAFLTLGFAQLWHVFAVHDPQEGVFRNQVTRNRAVWGAVALSALLLAAAVLVAPLASAMNLVAPDGTMLALILAGSVATLIVLEVWRALARQGTQA